MRLYRFGTIRQCLTIQIKCLPIVTEMIILSWLLIWRENSRAVNLPEKKRACERRTLMLKSIYSVIIELTYCTEYSSEYVIHEPHLEYEYWNLDLERGNVNTAILPKIILNGCGCNLQLNSYEYTSNLLIQLIYEIDDMLSHLIMRPWQSHLNGSLKYSRSITVFTLPDTHNMSKLKPSYGPPGEAVWYLSRNATSREWYQNYHMMLFKDQKLEG